MPPWNPSSRQMPCEKPSAPLPPSTTSPFRSRGECFGILGPNGAGKTSTIRMVYGFSPLTGGRSASSVWTSPGGSAQVKARIGVCQQENNLDPDLTVLENLVVFARYFDIPRRRPPRRPGSF